MKRDARFGKWNVSNLLIILKRIFEKWDGGMDWIGLAQDRGKWRAVANEVMSLQVP